MNSYEIKFMSMLDGNTINESTCSVKDETGKNLKCSLKYNESNQSIKIIPNEICRDNKNYYLIISDGVKTSNGGTMGKRCQIRFKVLNRNLVEVITLRGKQCLEFDELIEKKTETKTNINDYASLPKITYAVSMPEKKIKPAYIYAIFIAIVAILAIIAKILLI